MEDKYNKHDVLNPVGSPATLEEYEELLSAYKVQNPAKYELKEKSGEFDRMREKLGGKKEKVEDKKSSKK